MLHRQEGNSLAQVDAILPVGADIQTFKLCSIAAFAIAFKGNDFPKVQMKDMKRNYFQKGQCFSCYKKYITNMRHQ